MIAIWLVFIRLWLFIYVFIIIRLKQVRELVDIAN